MTEESHNSRNQTLKLQVNFSRILQINILCTGNAVISLRMKLLGRFVYNSDTLSLPSISAQETSSAGLVTEKTRELLTSTGYFHPEDLEVRSKLESCWPLPL